MNPGDKLFRYKKQNSVKIFTPLTLFCQKNMANHLCLIVLIAVVVVDANSLSRVSSEVVDPEESVPYTDESFPRADLIKMLHSHLLRQLNMSDEDSLDAGPMPSITNNVVRHLVKGEEKEQQLQQIVIRPRNSKLCFKKLPRLTTNELLFQN